jgi:hypothetical protein
MNASVDWSNFWGLKGYARFAMLFFDLLFKVADINGHLGHAGCQ